MPQGPGETVSFKLDRKVKKRYEAILQQVYHALEEKDIIPLTNWLAI